ncbi:MAG: UDP-glucose 4-epimerase GalE [bacterium]
MNILVTGGAGYIGSHFVNKLKNKDGVNIFVIDNFSQGRNNIISSDNIRYYELDLINKESLSGIFKENNIDIVAHFAALASVPDSVSRPAEYYANNLIGGLNLLNAMIENNVDKIIFSSSASVYGEPTMEEIKEDHPKNPTNPYGYTKLVFENMLKDYQRAYGIKSISFRYFCAAGCDESGVIGEFHNPETHVIPSIINTILGKRKDFCVYGNDYPTKDGSGIRDYIHVNDIADAHILAMDKLFAGTDLCQFYNLGIGKGFSVLDLIGAAQVLSGKKLNYLIKPRRPGDPSKLIADAFSAQQELNWKPKYTTIESIMATAYNFLIK